MMFRKQTYKVSKKGALEKKGGVTRLVVSLVISFSIVAVVVLLLKWDSTKQPLVSRTASLTTIQGANKKIITTPYFTMEVEQNWVWVQQGSTPSDKQYIIRLYNGPLVVRELFISIDEPSPIADATNALSAAIDDKGKLTISSQLSEHCKNTFPKNTPPTILPAVVGGVPINCRLDGTHLVAVIGASGGDSHLLNFQHKDGKQHTADIVYRDSNFAQQGEDIISLLSTLYFK